MRVPIISRGDLHEVSEFATASGEIMGTEPQLNEISFLPLKEGRWLNAMDGQQRRNVIVLGKRVAEDAVSRGVRRWGRSFCINGIRFEVVGSMPHLGRGDNMWLNLRGYIPFQVMADELPHQRRKSSEFHFVCRVSAAEDGASMCWRGRRCTRSSGAITDSMPAIRMRLTSGIRFRNRRWSGRFSMS